MLTVLVVFLIHDADSVGGFLIHDANSRLFAEARCCQCRLFAEARCYQYRLFVEARCCQCRLFGCLSMFSARNYKSLPELVLLTYDRACPRPDTTGKAPSRVVIVMET